MRYGQSSHRSTSPARTGFSRIVEPFGFREFISSQQPIKYALLPFPCCLGLASDKALQVRGKLGDPSLTILYRADQRVKVIGLSNRSYRVPIFVCATKRLYFFTLSLFI